MSFQIPKTFYGAGYAVCAVLFFVSLMGNVDDKFRAIGIFLAVILFIIVTAVYVWDKDKYYYHIAHRLLRFTIRTMPSEDK